MVAAVAGGLAEDVVEGKTGFTFPMRDAGALLAILEKFDREASHFLCNGPEVDVSRERIRGLKEQVDELVGIYRGCVTPH